MEAIMNRQYENILSLFQVLMVLMVLMVPVNIIDMQ